MFEMSQRAKTLKTQLEPFMTSRGVTAMQAFRPMDGMRGTVDGERFQLAV